MATILHPTRPRKRASPAICKEKKFAIGAKSRDWLLNQLGNKLRQYKAKLKKKHYKAELPMEGVMEDAPETVEETQWNTLVSYWYSEEAKAISNRNKDNSKNIKHPHTLGRKTFARKRKEVEDALGREVDRATFFDECHKTKDGVYVNALTEEKMNEVYMKLAEKKLDGHELTEQDYEKAMKEVFGKDHPGRVRGMGPTITASKYFGGRFSNLSRDEAGTSNGSTQDGLMKFLLSYLAEKYPEDDLLSCLPPHLRRQMLLTERGFNCHLTVRSRLLESRLKQVRSRKYIYLEMESCYLGFQICIRKYMYLVVKSLHL